MTQRSMTERLVQTLSFEVIGIALVTPLYMAVFGASAKEGYVLIIAISVAVMIWAPMFNTAFDQVEGRMTGRVASDRPQALRVVHAVLYEMSSVAVTLPLAMTIAGLSVIEALALNVQLTLFYVGYAYVFYLAWDRFWPVDGRVMVPVPA